jgi:2-oxoglutarate ferredoxin oxidoreductase subunit gamma
MKQRYEIVLAGSGGQGLVLSGSLLARAAILEGKNTVQTQSSFGDSQRGGLSLSEVLVDTEEIIFQQVRHPDVILALSDRAIKKYADSTGGASLLYDSTVLDIGDGGPLHAVPFTELAMKIRPGAANMVALGAIVEMTGVVRFESLEQAIRQTFSANSANTNIEAARAGRELAKADFNREKVNMI